MNYCYILFSPSLKKFYTGITQESVGSRLQKHNFNFMEIITLLRKHQTGNYFWLSK
ncbi:MAG: GIY-YIG nuclease family protein [Cyclobacteriaceae bacterium]|nr:GIY-YIG nuclease family protein [Cyclobacteriaceae bacterium]